MAYGKGTSRSKMSRLKKKAPKGFHTMPNGKLMRGAKHPTKKKAKKK